MCLFVWKHTYWKKDLNSIKCIYKSESLLCPLTEFYLPKVTTINCVVSFRYFLELCTDIYDGNRFTHGVLSLFFSFFFSLPWHLSTSENRNLFILFKKLSIYQSTLKNKCSLLIFLFLAQTFYNTSIVTEKFTKCEIQRFTF